MKPTAQVIFGGLVPVAGIVLFFLSGCASTQVESPLAHRLDSLDVTAEGIRQQNLDRVVRSALLIELASDSILNASHDALVRRKALIWKLCAIPAIRQALLSRDPIASGLDGWAFSVQMRLYLESGEGSDFFGDQQPIAQHAAHAVESLFDDLMGTDADPDRKAEAKKKIETWAENHPIESPLYERPSIVPFLKELQVVGPGSMASAVGSIAQNTKDLSDRMNLYATQIPREVRWQAEYLLGSAVGRLDSLELKAAAMSATITRMAAIIEEGRLVVDLRALRNFETDLKTLEEQITRERVALLADVDRQRLETIDQVGRVASQTFQDASQQAMDLIDHLAWRFAEILAAGIIVLGIMFVVLNRFQKKNSVAN